MVEETRQPAIGMARIYPPDPARAGNSFMGGVPNLPPDIPWPLTPATGEPRVLIAEIDCSELPTVQADPWLPATGTFWFFADQMLEELHELQTPGLVLYDPGPAGGAPPRHSPVGPPWWEGPWGAVSGWDSFGPKSLDGYHAGLRPYLAQWPLEFAPLDTYRNDWNQNASFEDDADTLRPSFSASNPRPRLKQATFTIGEWEPLDIAYARLLREAWAKAFGTAEGEHGRDWRYTEPWMGRRENPITWMAVRASCHDLRARVSRRQEDNENPSPDMRAHLHRVTELTDRWLAEADLQPNFAIMPEARKHAFLDELQTMPPRTPGGLEPNEIDASSALRTGVFDLFNLEVTMPGCGPDAYDPALVDSRTWDHRPWARLTHFSYHEWDTPMSVGHRAIFHRLMGASTVCKFVEAQPEDHIVLAEFSYDRGLDLKAGDLWSLIYWIRPKDLVSLDFDRIRLTWGEGSPDYEMDSFRPD